MKQASIQITFEGEELRAAVQEYISDCEQDEPARKPQKKTEVPR